MKLLGRDIPARELIFRIEERLRTRGLPTSEPVEVPPEGVEPRVEPLTFNLHALEENADATRALLLHTHRGGAGQLVLVAKWAFRKSCQVFINEALGRQRVFNGHVRDSYAQLSAEVIRLRREVEELRARGGARPYGEDRRPMPAQSSPMAKATPSGRTVEEREPAAKAAPSASPTPAIERARRPGEFPSVAEPATSASAAPTEQDMFPREPASTAKPPSTKHATPARESRSSRGAASPSKRSSSRRNMPPAEMEPQAKPASNRKPTTTTKATPLASGEPVLPKPPHARSGESPPPRAQEGAPYAPPETASPSSTSTTEKAGQRSRKPGAQRRGRRK